MLVIRASVVAEQGVGEPVHDASTMSIAEQFDRPFLWLWVGREVAASEYHRQDPYVRCD